MRYARFIAPDYTMFQKWSALHFAKAGSANEGQNLGVATDSRRAFQHSSGSSGILFPDRVGLASERVTRRVNIINFAI